MNALLVTLLSACLCSAATVTFGTGVPEISESNSYNGTNVATVPAGVWHAPLGTSVWESIQTDSLTPPIPNGTLVNFSFLFSLPNAPTSGTLGVLVDDSAAGVLNGNIIFNNIASPQGANCAASQPNCLVTLSLNILPYLVVGTNQLNVLVRQDGGAQFGIDVFGQVGDESSGQQSTVPEPLTFSLIGGGLLLVGIARKRLA